MAIAESDGDGLSATTTSLVAASSITTSATNGAASLAAANGAGADLTTLSSPVFYPSDEFKCNAHIRDMNEYHKLYKRSVEDPEGFWSDIAKEFYFKRGPTGTFLTYNFDISRGPVYIKWLEGAQTNMCYNVVDRIIDKGCGDRVAYIW